MWKIDLLLCVFTCLILRPSPYLGSRCVFVVELLLAQCGTHSLITIVAQEEVRETTVVAKRREGQAEPTSQVVVEHSHQPTNLSATITSTTTTTSITPTPGRIACLQLNISLHSQDYFFWGLYFQWHFLKLDFLVSFFLLAPFSKDFLILPSHFIPV